MIVMFRDGKCVGKTREGMFVIPDGIDVVPFDKDNDIHRTAKFLQHPPKQASSTLPTEDIFTIADFLFDLLGYMGFISHERITVDGVFQQYSKSGIRRLIEQKCVTLNGVVVTDPNALFVTCESLVLFANSTKRTTIF